LVTRRDFLKLAGMSAASAAASAGAALVGLRQPQPSALPGFAGPRSLATLCTECPAGCALNLIVAGDRLLEAQPNLGHPLACSGACDSLGIAVRRLESPARLPCPQRRSTGWGGVFQETSWSSAAALVGEIFTAYRPGEIAFLLGDAPDHLNDLVQLLALALGGATVLRVTSASLLDGRVTLQDAVQRFFGLPRLPYFDLKGSDLVLSFGVVGGEPWLARFTRLPDRPAGQAWIHFTPLRPSRLAAGDEWIMVRPGGEALLAQALGTLVARIKAGAHLGSAFSSDEITAGQAAGVAPQELLRLARRFALASSPVAIPGASCLGQSAGLAAAQSVLALNLAAANLGRPGGLYLPPPSPLYPERSGRTATLAELQSLLERMQAGQIKVLFLHGIDLFSSLPVLLDSARLLEKGGRIISFNSLKDETSPYCDALLPDHLPLESWGYQRLSPLADRPLVSAIQPAFAPRFNTRSTADLLLEAVLRAGGNLAASLPYRDEQEFIRQALARLSWGSVADPWAQWLSRGGWWTDSPRLLPPVSLRPPQRSLRQTPTPWALDPSGAEFYLAFAQPSADLDGAASLPGGISPAALHPAAVERLGLRLGDAVRLVSPAGEIMAFLVENPQLQPDTLVLTLQRGHAGDHGPLDLVKGEQNQSGDLAYQSGRVRVLPVID
jgi:molybdopterin-containing oxidoreductase family iron-sulfur binding subunit